MLSNYADIIALAGNKEPLWYDNNGCPRFAPFRPELCPSIYSSVVALLRISCQECHEEFLVEMHSELYGRDIPVSKWHYGDPPAHGCVGDTMNCDDVEVVEFWVQELNPGEIGARWVRYKALEGPVESDHFTADFCESCRHRWGTERLDMDDAMLCDKCYVAQLQEKGEGGGELV